MQITKPIQNDWQNPHLAHWFTRSFGAFICTHSKKPHFSPSVRRNFTARLTTNTQQTNSSMVFSSYP